MTLTHPVMWYDDSSPFRSKDMSLRRKLEPLPSVPAPPPPRRPRAPSARVLTAQALRQQGFSAKVIASLFGVSRQRVYQMFRRAGK